VLAMDIKEVLAMCGGTGRDVMATSC